MTQKLNSSPANATLLDNKPSCPYKPSHPLVARLREIGEYTLDNWDQFSFLGNRARYEFIELDMSTGLDLSIPSSRPLTFPGGQSENGYRAR